MILKVFTKEDSREMREAINLAKKFEERHFQVQYLDADDPATVQQVELYDIYSFPSFVVASEDGREIECWRGKVPLFDDVFNFISR